MSLSDYQSEIPSDLQDVSEVTDLAAGPVVFRHDNKLFLPGHIHFTKEQVRSFDNRSDVAKRRLKSSDSKFIP